MESQAYLSRDWEVVRKDDSGSELQGFLLLFIYCCLSEGKQSQGGVAQQAQALASQDGNLSLVPRTQVEEEGKN